MTRFRLVYRRSPVAVSAAARWLSGCRGLAARSLSLPFDAWLTDAQVASVSAAVLAASRTCARSVM